MESIPVWVQLINSVGFPIVACSALGFFIYKLFLTLMEQSKSREEKLYTTIKDTSKTNQALSKTNAEFVAVLQTYKVDLDDIKEDVAEIKQSMKG